VVALRRTRPVDLGVGFRLAREVRRFRPHVVHSFLFPANLLAAAVGRATGVPRIVVSQRSSYEATLSPIWRRLARVGHRLAHRVVVNSQAAMDEEVAAGFPRDLLVHVPNAAPEGATVHGGAFVPDRGFVLSLGQLDPHKGHATLIAAWPEVVKARPDAQLVLVGDGPCRTELEAMSHRLGVVQSVTFAGFHAPAAAFVSACEVLVQPSLTEGMPNAVLEAMAAGRPVVGTRAGGIPELVADGETGLLVPPGDPAALARALVALLQDKTRARAMGAAGAVAARGRFSIESVRHRIEEIYGAAPDPGA
jgi:glycosyltransferase involved in cell wall biosynthesis